jgi:hypothetical protein
VSLASARAALAGMDLDALALVGVELASAPQGTTAGASVPRTRLTGGARDALIRTLREAEHSGQRELQPRHLALALLTGQLPDPATELLSRLGVDRAAVEERLRSAA